jgi:hypothetical protein
VTAVDAPTLAAAVLAALGSKQDTPQDSGAVRLAQTYAEAIDADRDQLAKLGPGLLAVLESLGLTPRARAALLGKGGETSAPTRNRLDDLRERRRARADRA